MPQKSSQWLFSETDGIWGFTLTSRNHILPLIDYITETDGIRGFTSASQDLLRAAPGVQCRRQESPTWPPILLQCYLPTNFLNSLVLDKFLPGMPMVKTLLSALKASGCPVDLKRHLVSFIMCLKCGRQEFSCVFNKHFHKVCEMCQPGSEVQHAGGYDPALNQVPKHQ